MRAHFLPCTNASLLFLFQDTVTLVFGDAGDGILACWREAGFINQKRGKSIVSLLYV
jgi:hypothetical protein